MATSTGVTLSGLASGLDWNSIVNQLLTIERAPETQMKNQQALLLQKTNAYKSIGTQLTSLSKDIATLSDPSFFDSRTTTMTNPAAASATAAAGTPLGSFNFNITQLATDAVQMGSDASGKPLSATNDVNAVVLGNAGFASPVSAGTFTVNGAAVTIATTDTLQAVFDKINVATGGVVTGSYDSTTDEISLTGTGPIVLGSATDSSNFLQVAKLYNNGSGLITSTSGLGGVNLSNTMGSSNLATTVTDGGAGAGEFIINGVHINYNASTDSLNKVLQRINDSGAGVTATYDSINDRFLLTNKTTGDVGIALQDVTGNFLAATGLTTGTLQRGANLRYTVNNGGVLTSQSNTIDGTSSGIAGLQVTALSTNSTIITVGTDTPRISAAISSFVTDYNATQSFIRSQTTPVTDSSGNVAAGPLTGQMDVEYMATKLRQMANATPSGLNVIKSLSDLGLISNGTDNTITLGAPSKLTSALSNNLNGVKDLFTNATNGLAATLKTYLDNVTSDDGMLANNEDNFTKQSAEITKSINALEVRITNDQTRLTNSFVAMETAINTFNSQKQYLDNFFNGSTSTSGAAPKAASVSSGS